MQQHHMQHHITQHSKSFITLLCLRHAHFHMKAISMPPGYYRKFTTTLSTDFETNSNWIWYHPSTLNRFYVPADCKNLYFINSSSKHLHIYLNYNLYVSLSSYHAPNPFQISFIITKSNKSNWRDTFCFSILPLDHFFTAEDFFNPV